MSLYNPERTLAAFPPDAGGDCLVAACTALHDVSADRAERAQSRAARCAGLGLAAGAGVSWTAEAGEREVVTDLQVSLTALQALCGWPRLFIVYLHLVERGSQRRRCSRAIVRYRTRERSWPAPTGEFVTQTQYDIRRMLT